RDDERAARGIEPQVQRLPRGVLDLLDRESVGPQDPGHAQPSGRADRRHLEPIARLELRRVERTRRSWHTRRFPGDPRTPGAIRLGVVPIARRSWITIIPCRR